MVINGIHYPNITCPRCRYRHPVGISCRIAKEIAAQNSRPPVKHGDPRTVEEQLQELFVRVVALEDRLGLYRCP